jgi:hypothetical protein
MLVNIIGIVIAVAVVLFIIFVVKKLIILALNSVIGLFAFFGWNFLFNANIPINFWTIIITAAGGIFGFAFVIIMHYLKLGFL